MKEWKNNKLKIGKTARNNFSRKWVIIFGFFSIYDGLINIFSLGFYHGYSSDEMMDKYILEFKLMEPKN